MEKVKSFLLQLATFFGVGNIPFAPGTFGTLAAIPLCLAFMKMGAWFYMGFTIFLIPISIISADLYEKDLGEGNHDLPQVVIDEVVGFLITMTWLPITWKSFVAGFILFRILDILKPFPIGMMDKKIPGGLGVVADDVAAGIIANILLQIIYTYHPIYLI
jgi:phosphatidylglycerophosphatase A